MVVNDLGGGMHGDGRSSKAADAVVDEIKAKGNIRGFKVCEQREQYM